MPIVFQMCPSKNLIRCDHPRIRLVVDTKRNPPHLHQHQIHTIHLGWIQEVRTPKTLLWHWFRGNHSWFIWVCHFSIGFFLITFLIKRSCYNHYRKSVLLFKGKRYPIWTCTSEMVRNMQWSWSNSSDNIW